MKLEPKAQAELERRVRAATSTQRSASRARIILACAEGGSAHEVARKLDVSSGTVERWRGRFLRAGLDGLEDRARPGHTPKFSPAVHAGLIAVACEPVEVKDGKTMRTLSDVRQEAMGRGIVENISRSSVQRILAKLDVRPHLIKNWMHSPDPLFREKVNEITELYVNPPPGSRVVSIDEKPGMQALERRFPDRPAAAHRRPRRESEYRRHGTQTLLCSFEVHTGKVLASCGDTRKAEDLVEFMESVARTYPSGTVHVIWDNLNIHYDGADDRWTDFNRRHGDRFLFHYTPKHASWVNQVELFFSILQRQCLRHGSFRSKEELRAIVLEFIASWNRDRAKPFRWTFTGYPLQSGMDLKRAG